MSTTRVYNFNSGPATMPIEVLKEIRNGFMDFKGMSVLEISHRSQEFAAIIDEARDLIRELMHVPDGYHILFLHGGASMQFAMVPANLMVKTADYAITGHWAEKAFAEAKLMGSPQIAYSSEETGFDRVPEPAEISVSSGSGYLHITSNNTIYGTQYHEFPDARDVPLVADMSSDIMSREIDVSRFGLIYAGAQKNLGPAGMTVVIIREDLTKRSVRELPTLLKYSTHVEYSSLYNTPPVFAIYATLLVLRWTKRQGGVAKIEGRNRKKAAILYDALDASSLYKLRAQRESRSLMNVTFTLPSDEMTERFINGAKERGLVGLKGHRSIGGIRASIYNAFPIEGVRALVEYMREFEHMA